MSNQSGGILTGVVTGPASFVSNLDLGGIRVYPRVMYHGRALILHPASLVNTQDRCTQAAKEALYDPSLH